MDIFQKLLQIEDETGGDVSNLRNLINSGQLTTLSNIPQPDPKESVREIELFNRFNRDYPNYADGGRIGFPVTIDFALLSKFTFLLAAFNPSLTKPFFLKPIRPPSA